MNTTALPRPAVSAFASLPCPVAADLVPLDEAAYVAPTTRAELAAAASQGVTHYFTNHRDPRQRIRAAPYPAPPGHRWQRNLMLRGEPVLVQADNYMECTIKFRDADGRIRMGLVEGQGRKGNFCIELTVRIVPEIEGAPEWADLAPSQVIGVVA